MGEEKSLCASECGLPGTAVATLGDNEMGLYKRKINILSLKRQSGKVEQAGIFERDQPALVYFSLLWLNLAGRLMKTSLILGC